MMMVNKLLGSLKREINTGYILSSCNIPRTSLLVPQLLACDLTTCSRLDLVARSTSRPSRLCYP